MARIVGFTRMEDGTAEDYALLSRIEAEEMQGFADRVLGWLLTMEDSAGYQISRLEHCLQAATRGPRPEQSQRVQLTGVTPTATARPPYRCSMPAPSGRPRR